MHNSLAEVQATGDWDELRSFLAIARRGSLQRAARALGVNHSTMFRRLNALEARLGVRLFDRSARGYALTSAGEHMLASAERIEDEILALERRLLGGDVRLAGTLRVTTTDTLVHGLLGPHLRAFQAAYPAIELELITGNAVFDLSKREADVALRPSRHPGDAMVGRRLGAIAVALYGAREYLAERGQPASAAKLAGHALILGDASLAHLPATRRLESLIPAAASVLRCNSWLSQFEAARAGLGLAALRPRTRARACVAPGAIAGGRALAGDPPGPAPHRAGAGVHGDHRPWHPRRARAARRRRSRAAGVEPGSGVQFPLT